MAVLTVPKTISVEKYLSTVYRPDCDFVDGHLEKRNLGELDHSTIQTLLAAWFVRHDVEWGTRTRVELRVQVLGARYRVPDVCVLNRHQPQQQVVRQAPLICIEVLSPEDTLNRLRVRVSDYLRMGVEHVWIIDPEKREGTICTPDSWIKVQDGKFVVPGTEIYVPLDEIFAGLDQN
jgi:Uma2 family endonuclease